MTGRDVIQIRANKQTGSVPHILRNCRKNNWWRRICWELFRPILTPSFIFFTSFWNFPEKPKNLPQSITPTRTRPPAPKTCCSVCKRLTAHAVRRIHPINPPTPSCLQPTRKRTCAGGSQLQHEHPHPVAILLLFSRKKRITHIFLPASTHRSNVPYERVI